MAFVLDRDAAASRLWVSSRTIDRHIQAGRIRTKRIGKKIFLEDDDVEALRNLDPARREEDYVVIFDAESTLQKREQSEESLPAVKQSGDTKAIYELVRLYEETQNIVARKEETIQELSYKLWKAETEMKNMIPLVEYNKATFMLESAKSRHDSDAIMYTEKLSNLEKEVTKRNAAIISLALLFVLVLWFSIVFLFYTRLL